MKFDESQAIYLQIADHMNEQILTKKWREGDRIPSVRDVAKMLEVNPNTVMRSFSYLQDKGTITNQRGIGYFVSENVINSIKKEKMECFEKDELPRIFYQAKLLGYDGNTLSELYEQYLEQAHETVK